MNTEQLKHALEQHKLWLRGEGGQKANLSEANLSEANLSGADLHRANLSNADLSGADLHRANLHRANLHRANLNNADLSGADLHRANLSNADLSGADLSEANLSEANLSNADLSGADLSEAKGIMQFGPMPTRGRMIYAVSHDSGWMVQAGCFWGNLDELEAAVKEQHNCPAYLGFIQLLRTINN